MGEARWLGGVGQGRADHPWSAAVERGRSTLPVTGDRIVGWGRHFQVPGLGRRVSGSATQVQAQVQALCHLSSVINSAINPALHSVLHSDLYSALPYLPFLLCFLRYSTGVHPISRLNRRLKKVTWRKPQARAISRTLRSPSRSSRRAACRRSSLTNALKL